MQLTKASVVEHVDTMMMMMMLYDDDPDSFNDNVMANECEACRV